METVTRFNKQDVGKTACYEWKGKEFYSPILDVNEKEQLFKIKLPLGETWVRTENTNYIPF